MPRALGAIYPSCRCSSSVTAPVSSFAQAANRIAPHTHRVQAQGVLPVRCAVVAMPPQKNVGTAPRPMASLTERWLPMFRRHCPAGSRRRRCGYDDTGGDAALSIQNHGFTGLQCSPGLNAARHDRALRRSSASHQRAAPPSSCGSRRARACGRAPWWQVWHWSVPACVRRSAWPADSSAVRSWPPR